MRVVLYLTLPLLLIAMGTNTLATQPVKRDASEGQSNPEGCISDWRGLKKAYLDRQSTADVENSIFDFYPSDAINYGVLVMFYDVGPPPNTSTSGRRECCQRGSKDCIIHFIYRFRIFGDIHPELLDSRAFVELPIFNKSMPRHINQLCWVPLQFCSRALAERILHDFTKQFIGVLLQDTQWSSEALGMTHRMKHSESVDYPIELQTIPVLLFATVGLCLVLYIHHSWGLVGTVLAHSQVARHTMRSTMLVSWLLFPWMMVQFYLATTAMADTVREKAPFTLFQDVYTPQVTAGYVEWGSFLSILLLEAPFLCVFFLRKSSDLHNRKQRHCKTDCCLCYWIRVLGDTLGGIGVVAAVQITSVYLFYCALYMTVSTAYTIFRTSLTVSQVGTTLMCFLLLQQLATTRSSTCSILLRKGMKCVIVFFLGLIYLGINNYLRLELDADAQYKAGVAYGVLGSVVNSVVIGIFGHAVRKMWCCQVKEEVERVTREEQQLVPLIKGDLITLGLNP